MVERETSCIFVGVPISRSTKYSISRKLNAFLENDFEWFRDRAEISRLKTRNDAMSELVLRYFGNRHSYYDIGAIIVGKGNVRFEISDEYNRSYLVFFANQVSGKLSQVHVRNEDSAVIQRILNLLIKPSWIG